MNALSPYFGGFMDVVFYKTKLSDSNRCYGAANYDSYLASCNKKTVTLSHDVVPNNSFNIETTEAMWQYNYITFVYKGYKFGAFIDSVSIQAISGTTVIKHHTDNWYFVLQNIGINNIDFHGQVARAHVNDYVKDGNSVYPTLENTTATPEEQFNTANLKLVQPRFDRSIDSESANIFASYWLYVYIANPTEISDYFRALPEWQSLSTHYGSTPNTGITLTYIIQLYTSGTQVRDKLYAYENGTGSFTPMVYNSTRSMKLSDLTSTAISAITISKIPPTAVTATYQESLDRYSLSPSNLFTATRAAEADPTNGLPTVMSYCMAHSLVGISSLMNEEDSDEIAGVYCGAAETELTIYSDYIVNIPKLRSFVYQPVYVGDNVVNTLNKFTANDTYIPPILEAVSLDLTTYFVTLPDNTRQGRNEIMSRNNLAVFSPAILRDYWTRLNSLQTSIAATVTKNKAINQGVKNITGIVKSSLSTLASGGKAATAIMGGDIGGGISAGSNVAGGIVDIVEQSVNFQRNQENVQLQQRSADIQKEVADFQYSTGQTQADKATSYFSVIADTSAECLLYILQPQANKEVIGKNLHRFGYNTFLQLDDVYFNHRRTHFNYIQTIDASVVGVPSDIAADIESMFNSGVHLWQDDVENFEQANYQEGLFNV